MKPNILSVLMMNNSSKRISMILANGLPCANDILYMMSLKGINSTTVAEKLNVPRPCVSQVVHGTDRSYNIATYIAAEVGTTVNQLWGDAYNYTPRKKGKLKAAANG
jgi:hypothetical protein